MIKLQVKPFSANKAYYGQKIKTAELVAYQEQIFYSLPKILDIPSGKLHIEYNFGLSKNSDLDNAIKYFQDVVARKYGFNDKIIYSINAKKVDVKKGEEFIEFKITQFI